MVGWDDDGDMPCGGMVKGCCDGLGCQVVRDARCRGKAICGRSSVPHVFLNACSTPSPHFQEVDEYGMPSSKTRRGGMNVMDVGDAGVYR